MSNRKYSTTKSHVPRPGNVPRNADLRCGAVPFRAPANEKPPVLLCVDEHGDALQLRKVELERLGFAVSTATSGSAAVAALEEGNIDAVLLVYRDEGLNAEAVAFEVKMRFPDVPVLLFTQPEMPTRILWLVDDYLLRSDPLQRVIDVLSRVAHSKRQSPHSPAK